MKLLIVYRLLTMAIGLGFAFAFVHSGYNGWAIATFVLTALAIFSAQGHTD
jgi:hypothetical protein